MKDTSIKDFLIFAVCMIVGILLGRILAGHWNQQVHNKVEEVLNRVIMIDVPAVDVEASLYLGKNDYHEKYLTAIDLSDMTYGIYEIQNNDVVAYAHGKCISTGDVSVGIYKIVETKSHIDYHDARYWNVVKLEEIHTGDEIIVSTPAYVIAEAPIELSEIDDLGGIEIGSESMLSVYDNGDKGTILLVINGVQDEYIDGINHKAVKWAESEEINSDED